MDNNNNNNVSAADAERMKRQIDAHNNAQNLRNMADVAIASKNPYGMAAGGALKAADKLSGGKASEKLGSAAEKLNRYTHMGRKLQNASNKLSESGISDAAGKAASLKNKTGKPTDSAQNDVGANNLKKSLSQKASNLWNQRKNKKNKNTNDETESNNNEESNDNSESASVTEDVGGKAKVRIKIKLAIAGFVLLIGIGFVGMAMAALGIDVSQQLPTLGVATYGTDNFESVYDKNSKEYKSEIAYYEKLIKASKEYEEKYGEEIKTSYVHAILVYVNYFVDFDEKADQENTIQINFNKMSSMVDSIIELMKPSDENNDDEETKTIDYEIDGEFYNNLKNSSVFKDYYKELLKEKDIDELLKEIFDTAKELDNVELPEETVLTSETEANVKEEKKTSSGTTTTTTKKMTINEYLSGSIYANTNNYSNAELVKAYTIAYSTNIVAENKNLSINSNSATITGQTCSVSLGCSYDANGNLVDGKGERTSQNTIYYNGGYYYKSPLTSEEVKTLNTNINSVFGSVLVNSDGTYPTLDTSKLAGLGDGDYKTVLSKSYGDLNYKNVGENSYILDGNYGTKKVLTSVKFYDQKDYSRYTFCGLKRYTIGGSGCGVTAMAIVASTYEKSNKYDPVYMNNEARKKGACGSSGTAQNFFSKEAATLKYKYIGGTKFNKTLLNQVLKHLSQGHLVVVRMLSGHFTNGGHYMVLGGVDPETKKVYVYDPNNRSNKTWRKTGNGWYSFNDIIVKEAYNFYIMWKG